MGVQALALGKIGNAGCHLAQRLAGVVEKAGLLHKVVHTQRAGEAGRAAGGQGVVGACKVIAQGLGHIAAQEDAARVFDLVQHPEGVLHADLQMLRRNDVAGLNGLVQVGADDDLPVVVHAGAGNGGTGQLGDLHLQLCLHGPGQRRTVGDKNRAGQLVVLGLAQQVCRHPGGVAAAVGQHQDLAGAGDHINAHLAEHLPLGGGNVDVAGADDLVHRRDGLGAVGQRGHGLCTAGLEDLGHTSGGGGGKDDRIHPAVLSGGGGHHDLRHARDLGRDDIHQHSGGIGRRAAGHIHARLFNGSIFLAQHDAGLLVDHKVLVHLLAVEALNVGGSLPQGLKEIGVHIGKGLIDLRLRHLQVVDLCPVKFQRVLLQRLIPPGADLGNDAVHHILHVFLRADVPVQDLLRPELIKIIQLDHFVSSCKVLRSASSMASISLCLNW